MSDTRPQFDLQEMIGWSDDDPRLRLAQQVTARKFNDLKLKRALGGGDGDTLEVTIMPDYSINNHVVPVCKQKYTTVGDVMETLKNVALLGYSIGESAWIPFNPIAAKEAQPDQLLSALPDLEEPEGHYHHVLRLQMTEAEPIPATTTTTSKKRQRETTVPKDKKSKSEPGPAPKRIRTLNFDAGVWKKEDRHEQGGETQFFTWTSYANFGDTTGDRQFFECTFVRNMGPYNKGETVDSIDHCASESLFKVYRTKAQTEKEKPDTVFDIQLLVFERPHEDTGAFDPSDLPQLPAEEPEIEINPLFQPPHRESAEVLEECLGAGMCCLLEHGEVCTEPQLRWLIDQTLRKLSKDKDTYARAVANFDTLWRKDGVKWDTGVAP